MNDVALVWILTAGGIVVVVSVAVLVARSASSLQERLLHLATTWQWEAPAKVWWSGAIRGRWRGLDVELRHMNRYKGVPERLQVRMKNARFPARVILKRRTDGIFSKPIVLFGPELVDLPGFAERDRYWIRSNERMIADRVVSSPGLAEALEPNLIARFDVVDIRPGELRVLRAIDVREVKKRFDRPLFQLRRDLELIEIIANEEWKLASLIATSVG